MTPASRRSSACASAHRKRLQAILLGQVSLSLADYGSGSRPRWELKVGASIDSGLFVDARGNSIEKMFGTVALRGPGVAIELWDDVISDEDEGPTFGAMILIDVFQ